MSSTGKTWKHTKGQKRKATCLKCERPKTFIFINNRQIQRICETCKESNKHCHDFNG
jgi:hypothetical protein